VEGLFKFAEAWGWAVTILVYFAYKAITAAIDKYIPDTLAARRTLAESKVKHEQTIEDRAFDMQEKMLTVVAANTGAIERLTSEFNAHLGALTRALDGNTQVLAQYKAFQEAFLKGQPHGQIRL
jgi:hypothetical protein